MKVFVVSEGCRYEGGAVIAVYASKELANNHYESWKKLVHPSSEYAGKKILNGEQSIDCCWIDEMEVQGLTSFCNKCHRSFPVVESRYYRRDVCGSCE